MDAVAVKPSEVKPSDILRQADKENLSRIRHTCSHVMAMAVQKLYPDAKVTIGPSTETGFYYDFDRAEHFTPSDLKAIAKEMKRIIKWDQPLVRQELPRNEMQAEI